MNGVSSTPGPRWRRFVSRLALWFHTDPTRWTTSKLGRQGERAAARFLRKAGYRVLARNIEAGGGEADLVCLAPDQRIIVIVEVKTRLLRSADEADATPARAAIAPEVSVHARKREKLRGVATALMRLNRWEDRPIRIDVVAVEWLVTGGPRVRHRVGA